MKNTLRAAIATASLAVLGISGVASHANAFNLRVPQINVLGGTLQGYLNSKGEAINVNTDQMDAQSWSQSASGNSLLTLMVELTGNANGNAIGIYNTLDAVPALYQVLPPFAGPGWSAMMAFKTAPTRVIVSLFDANGAFVGSTTYLAGPPNPNAFGFYIQNTNNGQTFYSQDGRNPGAGAQMLAYQGTGINFGEWWLCFEDTATNGPAAVKGVVAGGLSDMDFDDAVCILESVNPLATVPATLGGVKSLYRNK